MRLLACVPVLTGVLGYTATALAEDSPVSTAPPAASALANPAPPLTLPDETKITAAAASASASVSTADSTTAPAALKAVLQPDLAFRVDDRPVYERPHTTAEFQAGILALPGAPISPGRVGGETPFGAIGRGDATIMVGLDFLYRGGREWEVGAAARFGPSPTTDDQYGGPRGLARTHARSYFLVGVEGRYIPLHYRTFEGWIGSAVGAVVIADRFTTQGGEVVPTVLGIREVTVSTEGLSLGGQVGTNWNFSEHWVAGATLRVDSWFLPSQPACSPIGDCATLTGPILALQFGLSIGYRIPL